MPGQFLPADHSKGDANTLGGYMAVHDRPAAFEGSDGFSYSVDIAVDAGAGSARFAAYLLFVQWARVGAASPLGHLETDYLAGGETEAAARDAVGRMPLSAVKAALDALIAERAGGAPPRRWWDAMRADDVGQP
ncbi:MAG: hypothetical protein KGL38_06095 [Gemmatimonadota bacterium]|nr:hypothetical protein [Gemmatimonadota bacterium]MDE3127557.1 hypothetical protein [Gemmatimonadota bacterium]MDE3173975.1 hypothetical protein [Gemmatimonadota bacterium]MDE3215299.1 hypothetical protein [Gemmatimonadota bacterium]